MKVRSLHAGLAVVFCALFTGWADTIVVTNAVDDGPGSLQDALNVAALTSPAPTTITFSLPGTPPFLIAPTSNLNAIYGNVTMDGTTQPGYSNNTPVIIIDAGINTNNPDCLVIYGTNNLIRGLRIQNYGRAMFLNDYHGTGELNRIEGCHVISNSQGIVIKLSSNNIIGGLSFSNRNVVSGNTNFGIIAEFTCGNLIAGNWIGVHPTNSAVAMPNRYYGVWIFRSSSNVVQGVPGAPQVISGNGHSGINLDNCTNNLVIGNNIGCDGSGLVPVSNAFYGINVQYSANNVIGGTNAAQRNIISGNSIGSGINLTSYSTSNIVQGNYIGINSVGGSALPNYFGVYIQSLATENTVGGTNPGAGNVISGNIVGGVTVYTSNNIIQGNTIGLNALKNGIVSNGSDGVFLYGTGNLLGGTNSAAANVICGNGNVGVYLEGSNTVQGNFIGVNASGTKFPNLVGIYVNYTWGSLIGGSSPAARNVISGNNQQGIDFQPQAYGDVVQGNYIGLAPDGLTPVSNATQGIRVYGATNITIGGSVAGAGNVIAANGENNILLLNGAISNRISGNIIGLTANGLSARPNGLGYAGISVNAEDTVIGGTNAAERNVISGNARRGIIVSSSSNTTIIGNYIGLGPNGLTPLANGTLTPFGGDGIDVSLGAVDTYIGGPGGGMGNVIAGNGYHAINLEYENRGTFIQGNLINLTAPGTTLITNSPYGISIDGSSFSKIGGSGPGEGNVIFGTLSVLSMGTTNTHHIVVQGNLMNLDAGGNMLSTNISEGISIVNSPSNIIGGVGAAGNVIFSHGDAIEIRQTNATRNVVQGNKIGVAPDGFSPRKFPTNAGTGVHFFFAPGNLLGGTNVGEGNIIAHQAYGVVVFGGTDITRNAMLGNCIYSNFWSGAPNVGIDLAPEFVGADGSTPNDAVPDADSGPNTFQNFPVITNAVSGLANTRVQGYLASAPSKLYRLEFFSSDINVPEGKRFLGWSTVTNGANGTGTFNVVLGGYASTGQYVTATATDTNNNTSEFSGAPVHPLPALGDTDGDGMPDFWESQYGLNPAVSNAPGSDLDGDKMSDLKEYLSDTIPNNGTSFLGINKFVTTSYVTNSVTFPTSQFRNYALESSPSPTNSTWNLIVTNALGTGLDVTLLDKNPATSRLNYRVRSVVP